MFRDDVTKYFPMYYFQEYLQNYMLFIDIFKKSFYARITIHKENIYELSVARTVFFI